ncbi:MAG: hypothetical protein ACHQQQ_06235 [Bacteroidota bacterium]
MNAPTKSFISPSKGTLGIIIRTFEAAVTTWCRNNGHEDFAWQRNYYEHIIRSEKDLSVIRNYIIQNPLKWTLDEYYPNNDRKGKR